MRGLPVVLDRVLTRGLNFFFPYRRFLCIIDALLINPYLNLSPKPYLSRLVTQLLSTLITDRPNKMAAAAHDNIIKMDHVSYASQILKVAVIDFFLFVSDF